MSDWIKSVLHKVVERKDLTRGEALSVMEDIMSGSASPAQIAAFITGLRMKGESVEEITGFATVMRNMAKRINSKYDVTVDTCGTGGDGSGTFNISTVSAFVTAGAGVPVAKHGNKSVSSQCGSADLLHELGVNISASIVTVEACLNEIGIAFMFAPLFHGAMKHAIGPRKEIGIRTVFNILGPLTNPAGSTAQVIGVYTQSLIEPLAHVLGNLGSKHAFVVHGDDGLDEITTTTKTWIAELQNGTVSTYTIVPEDFGIKRANLFDLSGKDVAYNVEIAHRVLNGEKGPFRDIVLLNAAYAIMVGGGADDVPGALVKAADSIDSGKAKEKLELLIELTNRDGVKL
ncbi:anthranilate phosphoribosyltransferase [Chlamydiota bacterium]